MYLAASVHDNARDLAARLEHRRVVARGHEAQRHLHVAHHLRLAASKHKRLHFGRRMRAHATLELHAARGRLAQRPYAPAEPDRAHVLHAFLRPQPLHRGLEVRLDDLVERKLAHPLQHVRRAFRRLPAVTIEHDHMESFARERVADLLEPSLEPEDLRQHDHAALRARRRVLGRRHRVRGKILRERQVGAARSVVCGRRQHRPRAGRAAARHRARFRTKRTRCLLAHLRNCF
mmetsp:Transcript_9458/g.25173  ORF Transcript_9458/g.25173 Transcript_9458/m.25173 type:complete len:233 (-) Transcript_9458:6-704(-)